MIMIPLFVLVFALIFDLTLGDPKNKYHPTAWIGMLFARLVPLIRSYNPRYEKLGGVFVVLLVTGFLGCVFFSFDRTFVYLNNINSGFEKIIILTTSVIVSGLLLKSTIAIKGMQTHSSKIMRALSTDDLVGARENLSMIVKRDTKNLDRQHIISATLESLSENIVDGITGPLFYFAFFGLAGAFVYRAVNTADSMIGYKTDFFRNLGWFGATCDRVLNFVPARLTSMIMVIAGMIVGCDWKKSLAIMKRDGPKTESPNAGYPMATMAGALGVKFEKLDHYILGDGNAEFTEKHFRIAVSMMKVTAVLFAAMFTIPVVLILSYIGWWVIA